MKKNSSNNKGFTLFELLAVLAILSIIAAIAVPRVMQTIKNARIEALKSNMQLIANSMQRYVTEKELTSCIGGMFVINPNVSETEVQSGNKFFYNDNTPEQMDSSDAPTTPTNDSIHNITIDNLVENKPIQTYIMENYIEGGIPNHIRVLVYAGADNVGRIIVSYGEVDINPSDNSINDKFLINGIKANELGTVSSTGSYMITKTFELESGDGHDHVTTQ